MNRWFVPVLLPAILINATGLFIPILEPDGMLYATISRYMAESNDYINIWADGHDWLDKPHLPFWISALSFELLGISSFTYKLPAFLCWLLGLRYTFMLGNKLYTRPVAQLAVLIHATALHGVLALMDVRAEPYLTTFCLAAVYYLWKMESAGGWRPLCMAALFTAAALITKGLFAWVLIGGGLLCYWVAGGQLKRLLELRWYAYVLLSLLFIFPELAALYLQFDAHPEKLVFEQKGVSGIRFFFWDSQFGRFFKTGPITNGPGSGDRLFFLHTTLWAFLPWALIFFSAAGTWIWHRQFRKAPHDWMVYGGTLGMFLLFSLSRFQLPHYVVILFPFFALITARFLEKKMENRQLSYPLWSLRGCTVLLLFALPALLFISRPLHYAGWTAYAGTILVATLLFSRSASLKSLLLLGAGFSLALYPVLILGVYPSFMKYQSGQQLAGKIPAGCAQAPLGMYMHYSYSLEFFAPQKRIQRLGDSASLYTFLQKPGAMVYLPGAALDQVRRMGLEPKILGIAGQYHITKLNWDFLHYATRPKATTQMLLITLHSPVSTQ